MKYEVPVQKQKYTVENDSSEGFPSSQLLPMVGTLEGGKELLFANKSGALILLFCNKLFKQILSGSFSVNLAQAFKIHFLGFIFRGSFISSWRK